MNNTPDPIRDILEDCIVEWKFGGKGKAETAINAYILGEVMAIIGADEPSKYNDTNNAVRFYKGSIERNHLRQELRNKANKRFGELPSLYGVKAVIHEHAPDDTMTILPNPHKEQL